MVFFIDRPHRRSKLVFSSPSNLISRIGRHSRRDSVDFFRHTRSYAMGFEGDFDAADGDKHLSKGFGNFSARLSTSCVTSRGALPPPSIFLRRNSHCRGPIVEDDSPSLSYGTTVLSNKISVAEPTCNKARCGANGQRSQLRSHRTTEPADDESQLRSQQATKPIAEPMDKGTS
ncbi:uncharacterized protein G2W53_033027 [Senna tora]|uniref:Uncharacterized protein n=1 Tax=Senna tora TaxID=362788 RepID=A0A834SYG7_9FABA|nr:uncharacterized protein G2W53_033027 [Senna tora]